MSTTSSRQAVIKLRVDLCWCAWYVVTFEPKYDAKWVALMQSKRICRKIRIALRHVISLRRIMAHIFLYTAGRSRRSMEFLDNPSTWFHLKGYLRGVLMLTLLNEGKFMTNSYVTQSHSVSCAMHFSPFLPLGRLATRTDWANDGEYNEH